MLPGTTIPEWFLYKQPSKKSLSFWIRNKIPERIILCLVYTKLLWFHVFVCGIPAVVTNSFDSTSGKLHIHLMHLKITDYGKPANDRWTHVVVVISDGGFTERAYVSWMGVHAYDKGKDSREDIRFTDPNPRAGKSKVGGDMGKINHNCYPLLKKYRPHDLPSFNTFYFGSRKEKMRNTHALVKVKFLMSRIDEKSLPTCEFLFQKRFINSPLCPICETESETIRHVFLKCPWTRAVWFGSDLQGFIYRKWHIFFPRWPDDEIISGIVGNICWAIWKGRNECVIEGKPVDPVLALFRAKTLCEKYSDCYPLIQTTVCSTNENTCQGTALHDGYSHHLLPLSL